MEGHIGRISALGLDGMLDHMQTGLYRKDLNMTGLFGPAIKHSDICLFLVLAPQSS